MLSRCPPRCRVGIPNAATGRTALTPQAAPLPQAVAVKQKESWVEWERDRRGWPSWVSRSTGGIDGCGVEETIDGRGVDEMIDGRGVDEMMDRRGVDETVDGC